MSESNDTSDGLNVKVKQLRMTCGRTDSVLETGKGSAINRQIESLKELSKEVEKSRRVVELRKITEGEEEGKIAEWNVGIEGKLTEADENIKRLENWLLNCKIEKDQQAFEEKMKYEIKLHETKLKLESERKEKLAEGSISKEACSSQVEAKLPKLVISKFDGDFMDWQRFWGQFNESIEKSGLASIAKFSYLKELLGDNVKREVDSLPFTPEGYNRAKAILTEKYGKESEIVKAYVKEILSLTHISSADPKRIAEFSDKLTYCVRSLESLKKLDEVKGLTTMTLDKLPAIRGDLVRSDNEWENWNLEQLAEALRLWIRRNPADHSREEEHPKKRRERVFMTNRGDKPRGCVYCESSEHKGVECTKFTTVADRRKILVKKKLCFNCAMGSHQAAHCQSKKSCQKCSKRHHTSICDKPTEQGNKVALAANGMGEGVFPTLLVKVNGVLTRALIDSGANSSYVSSKVVGMLNKKPSQTMTKQVETLMGTHFSNLEVYDVELSSFDGKFKMDVKLTKINKTELLTIPNPHYETMTAAYPHLEQVVITDKDTKDQLPVHVILSVGDYAKVKTNTKPLIGGMGEPIAELTRLGWFIMSPGAEVDKQTMLLTQTSHVDYERLCRLDVLGLEDSSEHDQNLVHEEFKEQLQRSPEGWYETGLPWRSNHPTLKSNKTGSLRRLQSLTRKLQRDGHMEQYDKVIREQWEEGIIEKAAEMTSNQEFYLPHKGVFKESSETTKLRVVYDASTKPDASSPSLNECLNPGPSLQNKLWDVMVQQRAFPVMVSSDIRQAFLQIRVKEHDRDVLRFHWKKEESSPLEILRFTRVLFGLAPSPYLLQGVIETHLDAWAKEYPDEVELLRRSMYVDDLLSGGLTVEEAMTRKEWARTILEDATFQLHKWCSNVPALEAEASQQLPEQLVEQSYAKTQLRVKPRESKALGLKWDKKSDTLKVTFPQEDTPPTKRGILSKLSKIYDPLGLVSPLTLEGKRIFRDVCDLKTPWDADLNGKLLVRWKAWECSLPQEQEVPRSIVRYREPIERMELHSFGDASTHGVGTAVYAVVKQSSGTTQQLVAAKSRLAKRDLSIPRLELVAAHMATNLLVNVCSALPKEPKPLMFAWVDSTVALHWIVGNGTYKQFVANRVAKIQAHPSINWRYVPTLDNPADIASRGGPVSSSALWWSGPDWLQNPEEWPDNPVTQRSAASDAEAKVAREVLCVTKTTKPEPDVFDDLLVNNGLRRTLRVFAWVKRFIHNSQNQEKRLDPLDTDEVEEAKTWWIKRIQSRDEMEVHYKETSARLGLRTDERGITVCGGRILGSHPTYLPRDALFTEKLVQRIHCETLHGGVGLTMAALREKYWVPRLRSLVKAVRSKCWGCKRFRLQAITPPIPGQLPKDRTTVGTAFEITGVDFAGPMRYRKSSKAEGKAYLAIFACSLTRAVHLELLRNLETGTFIICLKRFIARRGRPRVVYSDNGGTFVKPANG